jgi:hypothetical protein
LLGNQSGGSVDSARLGLVDHSGLAGKVISPPQPPGPVPGSSIPPGDRGGTR